MKTTERKVTITCTEKQLSMLEMVCDRYSRLVCGQLGLSLQDVCEEAWERRHKTEEHPHAIGSEEWYKMHEELEATLRKLEAKYWGLSGGSYYGIGYDDYADTLWDMHQVMRHARYLALPPKEQEAMRITVMADTPTRVGSEPLIKVEIKKG